MRISFKTDATNDAQDQKYVPSMGSPNTMINHCASRAQRRVQQLFAAGHGGKGGNVTDLTVSDNSSNAKHTLEVNFANRAPKNRKILNESITNLQMQLSLYDEGTNDYDVIKEKLKFILKEQEAHLKEIVVID